MQEERRRLLESCQLDLCRDLDEDEVLLYLQSAGILPDNVVDQISSQKTALKRRLEVIKAVKVRGDPAYDQLYKALIYSGQQHLAALLEPLVSENARETREVKRIATRPQQFVPERAVDALSTLENRDPSAWVDEPMVLEGLLELTIDGVGADSTRQQLDRYNSDKSGIYPNFSSPKGMCLIINNRNFTTMAERKGTEVDCQNLVKLFNSLGYIPIVQHDLGAKEMIELAGNFARDPAHSRYDSVFVVVLTHGENHVFIGTDGETVSVEYLLSQFNSINARHLAGKPKIFIFQACRGDKYDHGVVTGEVEETDARPLLEPDAFKWNPFACLRPRTQPQEGQRLPVESDFLVAYATASNYVSWRNSLYGSWFVQAICEVFSHHAKDKDLNDMLLLVNRRVAHGKATMEQKKQMPVFSCQLRKKFYFFPGVALPH